MDNYKSDGKFIAIRRLVKVIVLILKGRLKPERKLESIKHTARLIIEVLLGWSQIRFNIRKDSRYFKR